MACVRLIVALLVVGVIAVATDAQALACEVVCASSQPAVTAPHPHESLAPQARVAASHNHGALERPQPTAAGPHNHEGHMLGALQDAMPSSRGELRQCVTVDDVTLRATMTREVVHSLVDVDQPTETGAPEIVDRQSIAAVAGSPPARNGPLQLSPILRI